MEDVIQGAQQQHLQASSQQGLQTAFLRHVKDMKDISPDLDLPDDNAMGFQGRVGATVSLVDVKLSFCRLLPLCTHNNRAHETQIWIRPSKSNAKVGNA